MTAQNSASTTNASELSTRALRAKRTQTIVAFAAIYIIWGSTYLAIRFAIQTLPPFLMAGVRFVFAGGVLYLWLRARGAPRPTLLQWRNTAIVGALLLFTGNGAVVWAEQRVTSSVVALLLAMTPFWMVMLDWLRPNGTRPTRMTLIGLLFGLAGIVLLIGPGNLVTGNQIDLLGAVTVIFAALSWAAGSIYARHAELPKSPFLSTGMEMLGGGVLLLIASVISGDWTRVRVDAISSQSLLAFGYLIVFGSFMAFSAYVWLLKHAPASRVATYAYVNPVVAVFLGWALANEPVTIQTLLAAAVIIAAVVIIITFQKPAQH